MTRNKKVFLLLPLLFAGALFVGCQKQSAEEAQKQTVKVGYFPNITHAQALVGVENGAFQEKLGSDVEIKAITFNSGTTEIEALFAGEIDLGYIGPSPAINGYVKSNGESLRVISGAVSGGAVLVGQSDLAEAFAKDGAQALANKKIASPSQGNTQDISLRNYIKENNLEGKVEIIPMENADQLTAFSQKELDGCWVPEPWGTRLITEAGGKLMIDERDLWPNGKFITTNIIASKAFLDQHPDLVKKWLEANLEVTTWINDNPQEAQKIVNSEIERLTTKKIADDVLAKSWKRIDLSVNPLKDSLYAFGDRAYEQGFLGDTKPDLSNIYDLTILNEITGKKY
ncbi:MAG: hypothetical protein A2233_00955 [Candidatus Kerfeldbacteria bacterium RIFOXYA2_FULL_38_24]|uniref:Sulfate ABC transporter substrate-binding protein n=1 Tax=Candidatus Kerfeldbacteria bacterium RIFOXYB2_FULL_38_14 TaxID=1798547 RepID=A0A1G2BG65_9BACT|nr:MAG: hypothetical protein A2233_00955 [Candidatus Kerfeldbacteria bacterium RIFOXYA2_FULL_38_24]OGY88122.1 MAG: hypothetical protein A2319_01685 [Candidatus Kerfeldbacteria bacterium RIFOXYB2_FULL_38_14]OGY89604.1 MAG: hypothetical protein A2458_04150 [Candidatus Kerfeldbacteria bacterium RIFOXYC2_FULL_38_9]